MKTGILIVVIVWISTLNYKTCEVIAHSSHVVGDKCKIIKRRFTGDQQKSILSGILIDCETQEPLKLGVLNISGTVFYTDSLGRFHKLLNSGKYLLRAGWPGYHFDTIKTVLRSGDSLDVVFYLKTDKRPLE